MDPHGGTLTPADAVAVRQRRRPAVRVTLHAGAVVMTLLLWLAGAYVFVFASFVTSVCGDASAHAVHTYRLALLGLHAYIVFVPLAFAALMRHLGERAWPYAAIATLAAIIGLLGTAHAQPSQWCF